MPRTSILLLALLSSVATAAPTVTAKDQQCTTEPKPVEPIVKARSQRGSILVDVVGQGNWCQSTWSASSTDRTIELVPTAQNVPAMPCGTCALRLQIDEVSRGRWTISVGGVKRTVDVR